MKSRRIFITGGHFMPAKATIEELNRRGDWQIFYIGRRFSMEDDKTEALEYVEIRKMPGVIYQVINTGRLQPKFFVNVGQSIKSLLKIFLGLGQSLFWILKFRPDIILSFGGYVAVPVVFWAWLWGIPIVTHEQTVVSGRGNKLIAHFADKVLVSWPESLTHFPGKRVVLTGNPLRDDIVEIIQRVKEKKSLLPTIYVAGGSQGSHIINEAVGEILPKLLSRYKLIHQTGDAKKYNDFAVLEAKISKLPDKLKQNYQLARFLDSKQVAQTLFDADLVITRSGANIVTELLALGKPAIFIPIPWSVNQEQMQNAQYVWKLGLAEILSQNKLNGTALERMVNSMMKNLQQYLSNASKAQKLIIPDAASRIVAELENLTA